MTTRRDILAVAAGAATIGALPAMAAAPLSNRGRLLEYQKVPAQGLPDQRLTIWLPPGYDEDSTRYPVLYMHDAQNLFDPAKSNFNKVWAADKAMQQFASETDNPPWIIVGIWSPGADRYRQYLPRPAYDGSTGRVRDLMDEYAQGPVVSDIYLQWIVAVLKPWIDAQFRTLPGSDTTAMAGSSMGGLISLYAFLEHADIFGRAACVSTHWPAIAPNQVGDADRELITLWRAWLARQLGPPGSRKLWFDHGTATLDQYYAPYQQAIDAHMVATDWIRGRNWESKVYPGAEHEENAWAARLPEILAWLLA